MESFRFSKPAPLAIGIFNAVLPGGGYIFIERRRTFGILLIAGWALGMLWVWLEPNNATLVAAPTGFFLSETTNGLFIEILSWVLLPIAFGLDAYNEAKRHQS